jgi:phosphatidylglycerol:prolipoprotein diacylglycerol transferase
LTIHWYGVLVAAGFLAGLWTASRRAPRSGIAGERIVDLGPWLILGTLVGARGFYVVSYWREFFAQQPWWEMFAVHHGGLIFYGGLLGASLAVMLYARVKRVALWSLADVLAPSVTLGHALGRVGCLLNGCCFGRPTDLPWAVCYPAGHETFPKEATAATPVHPVQLYEAALNLALYAGLAWVFRRRQFAGQVFAVYLISYAVLRVFVESFRGDYPVRYLGGIVTPAQLLSALVLAAGLLLYWKQRRPSPIPPR